MNLSNFPSYNASSARQQGTSSLAEMKHIPGAYEKTKLLGRVCQLELGHAFRKDERLHRAHFSLPSNYMEINKLYLEIKM